MGKTDGSNEKPVREIGLQMGAIAAPIKLQLEEQGFTLEGVGRYQEQADRINHLYVGNILTDMEATKARRRLFNVIKQNVRLK